MTLFKWVLFSLKNDCNYLLHAIHLFVNHTLPCIVVFCNSLHCHIQLGFAALYRVASLALEACWQEERAHEMTSALCLCSFVVQSWGKAVYQAVLFNYSGEKGCHWLCYAVWQWTPKTKQTEQKYKYFNRWDNSHICISTINLVVYLALNFYIH